MPISRKNEWLIREFGPNGMHHWIIDYDENKIKEMSSVKEIEEVRKNTTSNKN